MYFKTNDPSVINGWENYWAMLKKLQENAQAFAESFGANAAVITQDFASVSFRGIRFNECPNRNVWAFDKDKKYYWPRSKPVNKQSRDEFNAVVAKWKTGTAELLEIDKQMYLEPLGLKLGDTLFSGIGLFFHDGYIWIETNIKTLLPHCAEVLGSEWHKAKEEFNGVKK